MRGLAGYSARGGATGNNIQLRKTFKREDFIDIRVLLSLLFASLGRLIDISSCFLAVDPVSLISPLNSHDRSSQNGQYQHPNSAFGIETAITTPSGKSRSEE